MKILVLSDSHGKLDNVYTAMDFFGDEINCIVHLGDFYKDAKKIQEKYPDLPMFYVSGNNDFFEGKTEFVFDSLNKKILLTHGHFYDVYFGVDKLFYRAKELGVNVCIFGHTHNPFIEKTEDMFILNPGSISYPRILDKPTFAILEFDEADISAKIFSVDGDKVGEINI